MIFVKRFQRFNVFFHGKRPFNVFILAINFYIHAWLAVNWIVCCVRHYQTGYAANFGCEEASKFRKTLPMALLIY